MPVSCFRCRVGRSMRCLRITTSSLMVRWCSMGSPGPPTGGVGVFGYTSSWAFSSNGDWDGTLGPMAGVDDNTDIMTFAPSSPVAGIGGFINYAQPGEGTATIAAYNAADVLIESYSLTFTTGGGINVGEFLGFSESTADIAYFELTGATVGLTGLSVQENPSSSSLPEPGTVDLMLAGLG